MNQNPEQKAKGLLDDQLTACGWIQQNKNSINLAAGIGIAICEYQTDAGPADYILFVNKKPVGLIKAKREEEGVRLTTVEEQSTEYASAKLKYINEDPLALLYGTIMNNAKEIENRLSVSDKLEETISNSLKQPEALRQSILKKAFKCHLI